MKSAFLGLCFLCAFLACGFAQEAAPLSMRVVPQIGHPSWVNDIVASPDGRFFATAGGRDSSVKLWTKDGVIIANMGGHDRPATVVRFSPDGSYLASLGEDGLMFLWDTGGQRLFQLAKAELKVTDFEFTPDGKFIAATSNGKEGNLLFMDYRKGSIAASYPLTMPDPKYKTREWQELAVSPDGKTILAASDDEAVLMDYQGKPIRKVNTGKSDDNTLCFTPDGNSLLRMSRDAISKLRLDGDKWETLKEKVDGKKFALSRDGKTIAVPMDDTVELIGLDGASKGSLKSTLQDMEWEGVNVLAFHPDGTMVYSGNDTGGWDYAPCVTIWDFARKRSVDVSGMNVKVLAAQMRESDGRLVLLDDRSGVALFSRDLRFEGSVPLKSLGLKLPDAAGFSPKGDLVAFSEFGKIRTYDGDFPRNMLLPAMPQASGFSSKDAMLPVAKAPKKADAGEVIKPIREIRVGTSPSGGLALGPEGKAALINMGTDSQYWRLDPSSSFGDQAETILGRTQKTEYKEKSKPAAAFSPDGKIIALGNFAIDLAFSQTLIKTDAWWGPTTELVPSGGDNIFDTPNRTIEVLAFSPDGKTLAAARRNKTIDLYDMQGKLLKTLPGHDNYVRGLSFSPDGKLLVSAGEDGHCKIWNLESGDLVNLVAARGEWLVYTPDGYFDCSRNGGSLVALVKDNAYTYGIDQFAVQYNRPDIILKRLGSGNADLIEHYRAQYLSRLAKLGLREGELSRDRAVPVVELKKAQVNGKFLDLELGISGGGDELKSYNVYVNDDPVWGAAGKSASGRLMQAAERIELTKGRNKVEVTALNAAGAESYRALYWADCGEAGPQPDLYYLGFGVSQYKDASLNLKYAAKDAADLAKLFGGMKKSFGKVNVKTFLDKDVTKENIALAKEFLAGAKPEDVFVLFIAGHGVHDGDKAATYYYLGHEARLDDLAGSAIPFDAVEELLQGVAPRQKLFLMDTCESGEAEEAGSPAAKDFAGKRGVAARAVRGISVQLKGYSPGVAGTYKRDQYIYNDLRRRSGAIVFSSCRGGEYSFESDSIKNGYFTSAILAAFKDPAADADKDKTLSVNELRSYVSAQVPEKTAQMQHPTVDRDNIFLKFGFGPGK